MACDVYHDWCYIIRRSAHNAQCGRKILVFSEVSHSRCQSRAGAHSSWWACWVVLPPNLGVGEPFTLPLNAGFCMQYLGHPYCSLNFKVCFSAFSALNGPQVYVWVNVCVCVCFFTSLLHVFSMMKESRTHHTCGNSSCTQQQQINNHWLLQSFTGKGTKNNSG